MRISHTSKTRPTDRVEISESNAWELLKNNLKVILVKTCDDVEAILFFAQYFWDMIKAEQNKWNEFLASWYLDLNPNAKNLVQTDPVTNTANKKFSERKDIRALLWEVDEQIKKLLNN